MARASTHPVAIVVFVNAEGDNPRDAVNVAERAISEALGAASPTGDSQLVLSIGRHERHVSIGQLVELNLANRAGHINLTTSAAAYQRR